MSVPLDVRNVSIQYIVGDIKNIGIREYVSKRLRGEYRVRTFYADRNITFSLEHGDMLGIIGANGAGKSTLLKAVTGILTPSEGTIHRNGSLAALLELSSGFDGSLTVKENTYLRGAMLGYSRAFMNEKYDEIIAFAELEAFQDTPFRQLSSGMKSRLAFSIASLVKPDILILDEVLSVGDGAFRKKSEEKMRGIIEGGATTILVSHSLDQIRRMCNKILWLHKGEQILFGDDVENICLAYEYFLDNKILPEDEEDLLRIAEIQKKANREETIRKQNELIERAKTIEKKRAIRKKKKQKKAAEARKAAEEAKKAAEAQTAGEDRTGAEGEDVN